MTEAAKATGLKSFIDSDQLKRDIAINPNDLDSAMLTHAALYVHYAQQAALARSQYERMKAAFEILEARLDNKYREALVTDGKKPTEAAIKSAVTQDTSWSSANVRLIEAQTIMRLAEVASDAFYQRKDLLLECARDRRKEREGELRVMAQDAARDAANEIARRAGAAQSATA